jgi:CheY-like chemotaxis protein
LTTVTGDVSAPALSGVRILVVEDDPDSREVAALILSNHGARVCAVAGGKEGLESLGESPPDIVISDIGMPEMDGYEFIRAVRTLPPARGGAVPAIALTAFTQQIDRQRAFEAGFEGYLCKPTNPTSLITAIQDVLKRSA